MNPDLQKLQDMLMAMQQQRDQALNAVVVAQAENAGLRRTIAERDATIKGLTENVEPRTANAATPPPRVAIPAFPNVAAVGR